MTLDRPGTGPGAGAPDPGLTRAILARTSGSPCERFRNQACDFVDGAAGADLDGLMRGHLAFCPECAALARALAVTAAVLPAMVQVDPGPWFTQRVLRATLHLPRPSGLRATWARLMHRPRICLEAAYLGAAGSLLGLWLPMPSLNVPALVQPAEAGLLRAAGRVAAVPRRAAAGAQRLAVVPASPLERSWRWAGARYQALRARVRELRGEKSPDPANP